MNPSSIQSGNGGMRLGDLTDRVANISLQRAAAGVESAREALERGDEAEAAKQLEALFATLLVKEMRRALPGGFFGQGAGADIFEGWLDEHIGSILAQDGALGIAGMIKASMSDAAGEADQSGNSDEARAPISRIEKGDDR